MLSCLIRFVDMRHTSLPEGDWMSRVASAALLCRPSIVEKVVHTCTLYSCTLFS